MLLTITLLLHMHPLDFLPIATSPSSLADLLYMWYIVIGHQCLITVFMM